MVCRKSKSVFFGLVLGALISLLAALPYAVAVEEPPPTASVDLTKICSPRDGAENLITITIINDGEIPLTDCLVEDPLASFSTTIVGPINPGGFAVAQTSYDGPLTESILNTATVSCTGDSATVTAAGDDLCEFVGEPGLEVSKACAAQVNGVNLINVTVTNSGTMTLYNCVLTDELADGINGILLGTLVEGEVVVEQLQVTGLAEDTLNTAIVTCEDAPAGGAEIITQDNDLCEVPGEGCLTRTPGFWGTHPHITAEFLPLESAGLTLDTTDPATPFSATEDLCFSGTDFKDNDTSPQQLQLIRQCAAANLNVAATLAGGGDCAADFPGLSALITSCCDELANSGAPGNVISASSCIEDLDVFNNLEDTLDPYGLFVSPGPANPRLCWEFNGNGYVNPGRNLGPAGGGGGNGKKNGN